MCICHVVTMSLVSTIYAVPALLDACDVDALNTLSLTNSQLRQEVHACVRSVSQRPPQCKDIAALVSAPFMHLTDLHISSRLSVLQVSLLTNGEWPMLHKLELYVPHGTSASILQITAAPWPQLEELGFGPTPLDATHLKLLVKKGWPLKVLRCNLSQYMSADDLRDAMSTLKQSSWNSLQSVQLDFCTCTKDVGVAGLSELKKGGWQQLTKLTLRKWLLSKEAASHLVQGSWPQLQSLTICVNSIDAIPLLTQADWPQLTHLHLTQYLATPLDPGASSPGLAMLKHSSWPMLKSLWLTGLQVTSDILHAFSQANWALLEMFVSELSKWDAERIVVLSQVHWPMMESIYLDSMPSHLPSLVPILKAPWPCLKVFRFSSDGLHPSSIDVFIQAVQKSWVGCCVEEGNPQF